MQNDLWLMSKCLDEASLAAKRGEVPVAALLADQEMNILAMAGNCKEEKSDPTGHAEIVVIRKQAKKQKNWRLSELTLYTTLEPCLMCINVLLQARIKRLVFGAYDFKGGALSLGYHFHRDSRLNHTFSITGGVLNYESSLMLSRFFKERRRGYNLKK